MSANAEDRRQLLGAILACTIGSLFPHRSVNLGEIYGSKSQPR
jgi:hypothetical protein